MESKKQIMDNKDKSIITRKIQLYPIGSKEEINQTYATLRKWDEVCFRAANTAISHMFFQKTIGDFFYLTEEAKVKFLDINKDPEGVLNTSRQNTTYQVLSSKYKGQIPSDIYCNLNARLFSLFTAQSAEYFTASKSLDTYKRGLPMPISAYSITNIEKYDDLEYSFSLFGLNFRTNFSGDSSGNKLIWDLAQAGTYKFCNSTIQIKSGEVFLLASFKVDREDHGLDPNRPVNIILGTEIPVLFQSEDGIEIKIGSREEYNYRIKAIRGARYRIQKELRYLPCKKGRKKRLAKLEDFTDTEKNYVSNKQHVYSNTIIQFCKKYNFGTVVLTKPGENNDFLMKDGGYHGFMNKLKYKCEKNLIIFKEIDSDGEPVKTKKQKLSDKRAVRKVAA